MTALFPTRSGTGRRGTRGARDPAFTGRDRATGGRLRRRAGAGQASNRRLD